MKRLFFILPLLGICLTVAAQDSIANHQYNHANDTTDVFYRHLKLNEVTVTGVTGMTKLKYSTAPINIVSAKELRSTASTNIIDAIARQPGVSQLTTGSGISKPIIRGLGYNRVVVMSEGIRQEGQQWGDEHGVEVDGGSVGSIEILKGPASLMYGSATVCWGIRSIWVATNRASCGMPVGVARWHTPIRTSMTATCLGHSSGRLRAV